MKKSPGYIIVQNWFSSKNRKPFKFQEDCWRAFGEGCNGLLNAPTGSGKTYALAAAPIANHNGEFKAGGGLRVLWITPLKALSKDIEKAITEMLFETGIPWKTGSRTGDTSTKERTQQRKQLPEYLLITPESLHLIMASKNHEKLFKNLELVVVDEWHELMGNKRGVQVELALAYLKTLNPAFRTWGISATIGNLGQALDVILGKDENQKKKIVKANIKKKLKMKTLLPAEVEKFPWAGHLGILLLPEVLKVVEKSNTSLIFTNVRSQTEIWYQRLLEANPELAGLLAIHHGSLGREVRDWVENALHLGLLKAVVCTSSLDLGVDFRPVDTAVQVGSPKGVARFLQRAGRSGHSPGAESIIYFVPTNSLEIIEAAAIKKAMELNVFEDRIPLLKPMDVLVQFLVTLAVSGGFVSAEVFRMLKSTFAYQDLHPEEWEWALQFITTGGDALQGYEEYSKVEIEEGKYIVNSRRVATMHRLSIGTITSDINLKVQYLGGGYLGSIEEMFISKIKPGEVFIFAGKALELLHVRGSTAFVKRAPGTKGIVPRWYGGRMPLSSQLSEMLRLKVDEFHSGEVKGEEMKKVLPLLQLQAQRSRVPAKDELLIEEVKTREGYHLFFYPFEGRLVHEAMATLVAWRISERQPVTFSIAMNDYGFELLSDIPVDIGFMIDNGVLDEENVQQELQQAVNATEMARRRFRDIAIIAGFIFSGYPGKNKTGKHLQMSSSLLFEVLSKYDPDNLLVQQAYQEMLQYQFEEDRLMMAFRRINQQKVMIERPSKPTPFAFPVMVDRLRERLSSEKLEDRIKRMKLQFEKG